MYTLQQIAAMQQAVIYNKTRAIPDLGQGQPSNVLRMGKYSDDSNPITSPWELMPDGGFSFNSPGVIDTPIAPSAWTDVLVYAVPNGFDGIIRNIANSYNGIGFVQGSGALLWRILRNGQAVRNYDNIKVFLGDNGTGHTKIRISSNDLIQFQVQDVSLGGSGSQIFCYTGGWFYPVKVGA